MVNFSEVSESGDKSSTEKYLKRTGRWLPYDPEVLKQWLGNTVIQANENPLGFIPAVQALQELIESDTTLFMHVSAMFEQVPQIEPFNRDPLGRPQLRDYNHMLQVLNHVARSAPKWDTAVHKIGWVGFPLNAILTWPMSTPSGKAFFLNKEVNAALKGILDSWAEYLSSTESANVLSTEDGWLSPPALAAAMTEANLSGDRLAFEDVFICDPRQPYYGFSSWDDFFTRQFRPGLRPIASGDSNRSDPAVSNRAIANPCESRPYRLSVGVRRRDTFWCKDQPYSVIDMLAGDTLADAFVGGTVYQAFLSGLSYHRWHSPVTGTIVKTYIQPGTYYSKAASQGFGSIHTSLSPSQGYLAEVATRAIIFIEAENPAIGLMCVMPVGMAEVSTCEVTVRYRQRIAMGDQLGLFHYGGSTFCMLFRKETELEWVAEASVDVPQSGAPKRRIIPVNSEIAKLKA